MTTCAIWRVAGLVVVVVVVVFHMMFCLFVDSVVVANYSSADASNLKFEELRL